MRLGQDHPLHYFQTVPKRYQNATVSRESREGWDRSLHELTAEYLTNGIENMQQGIAPFITGASNAGKTYAAAAITNHLDSYAARNLNNTAWDLWHDRGFIWAQANDLFMTLVALQDFRRADFWVMDRLIRTVPWMVLDDISHLREFERHREMFWQYINYRYVEKLPTLITANFNLTGGFQRLDDIFGEPVRRRLQEMSEGYALVVTGERS